MKKNREWDFVKKWKVHFSEDCWNFEFEICLLEPLNASVLQDN